MAGIVIPPCFDIVRSHFSASMKDAAALIRSCPPDMFAIPVYVARDRPLAASQCSAPLCPFY